jgi:hypothetical protein
MAKVQISDYAIWVKHVHGDDSLKERLSSLKPNDTIALQVDGLRGVWRKMSANRTTGQDTPGLSPLGGMQKSWGTLFRERKGDIVDIALADDAAPAPSWSAAAPEDRSAAWAAFKALTSAGWRSEGDYGSREERHDRSGA